MANVQVVISGNSAGAVGATRRVEKSFLSLGRVVKATAAIFGGIQIARALKAAGKAAVDFDRGMRNVNSIAQLSEKQLAALSKQVLALAGPTAQAPKTLAEGLYDIVSSGFEANEAVKILDVSAKAATAGLTDTATATKAVTAVLNAYNLSADDARKVSDVLFQAVNLGVMTFEELASSIGDVLPFAAQLKVPIEDVGGAMATMTLQGLSAAESSTRLKGLLVTMIKPGEDLSKAINKLGFESGALMLKQLGLVETVHRLDEAANSNKQTLAAWFPNIRALGGFLSLSGDQGERFVKITKSMDQASAGAGATAKAFAEQSRSLAFQWDKAKASLTAAAIPIASLLFPALVKGAQAVADFAGKVSAAGPQIKAGFSGFVDPIKTGVESLFGLLKRVGDAIKGVLDFGGGGAGEKLSSLFKDAETAGRTLGTGLVILTGGLLAYKAAVRGAAFATALFNGVAGKSLVGILLRAGVFVGGAVASWFGLKAATESATAAAEQAAPAWDRAREAVEGLNLALATAPGRHAQLRDATLQVRQAELNVAQAIQTRNAMLKGLTEDERRAVEGSLRYQQAQLGVQAAYAALDNAERRRGETLDQVRQGTNQARAANRAFIGTLMESIRATGESSRAQQRQFVQLGGFRNSMLNFAAAARDGTDKMRRFTGATFALGLQLKRMPTRVEVETALNDKKFRPALLRALRDLDLLSSKDVKTTVDIKILAKDALKDVNKQLDEAKTKKANPKVIIELKESKAALEKVLEDLAKADEKKAKPKLEVVKGQFFKALGQAEKAISNLDDEKAQPKITVDPFPALRAVERVQSAIDSVRGRSVSIVVNEVRGSRVSRATGGFIPGADTGGRDAVMATLAPGEVVLNRAQQNVLGGPGFFARTFGFSTAGVPGVQAFAEGGFVSRIRNAIKRDKKRSGYKTKVRELASIQRRLDRNRDRQDRKDREIGQLDRQFSISVEEFIKVDADGNESLDTAAVQKRVDEINQLIGKHDELLKLIDQETQILNALIEALEAAVRAYLAEIKDQERVIREMTAIVRDASKQMAKAPDDQKAGYEKVIDNAKQRKSNAQDKIRDLRGRISDLKGEKPGILSDKRDQPLDRRDVTLSVMELAQERTDTLAIRARPPEPTSAFAESAASSAGADGFGSVSSGLSGPSAEDQKRQAFLEAMNAELRRQLGQLRLALGIQEAQVPVIGAFQRGTLNVATTGLALVHAGERITPRGVRTGPVMGSQVGGEVLVRLELSDELDRIVDARVIKAAPRVSVMIGEESHRRFRAGDIGPLTGPTRNV